MIIFQYVKCKNFFSVGNDEIEIRLDASPTTLVSGTNGSGKSSTLICSICFALFGRSFRKVKLGQIANSINNKDCRCEVGFFTDGHSYRVVRGLRPSVFEIYQDGILLNQDAHTRDYQEVLEGTILKFNYRTFTQVVIVGSASYTPFMQLPTGQRREVIEDLLDIHVFSIMNSLLKERMSKIKEHVKDAQRQQQLCSEKLSLTERHFAAISKIDSEANKQSVNLVDSIRKDIAAISEENTKYQKIVDEYLGIFTEQHDKSAKALRDLMSNLTILERDAAAVNKTLQFYDNNESCPTCKQSLSEALRTEQVHNCRLNLEGLNSKREELDESKTELQDAADAASSALQRLQKIQSKMQVNNSKIETINKQLVIALKPKADNTHELEKTLAQINTLREEQSKIIEQTAKHSEEKDYHDILLDLLKDTGIKTRVIRRYLPAINKQVNRYLEALDFFVSFYLDDTFSETIKSRHRDVFTYDSFSEGEKQRIDLAILFAWRAVAKSRNSISSNLLILDEVFDSSLDPSGTENLLNIMSTLEEGTNCFVISHNHVALQGKFEDSLHFAKKGNFTYLEKQ